MQYHVGEMAYVWSRQTAALEHLRITLLVRARTTRNTLKTRDGSNGVARVGNDACPELRQECGPLHHCGPKLLAVCFLTDDSKVSKVTGDRPQEERTDSETAVGPSSKFWLRISSSSTQPPVRSCSGPWG